MKFIVINKDKLTASDQVSNKAALLWKDETTGLESKQYVLRVSESIEDRFKGYKKYNEADIKTVKSINGSLVEKIQENVTPNAFNSKLTPDGKSLFKRVHGSNATANANGNTSIDFIIPYAHCKFSGADIFGCALRDKVDFFVLDTSGNAISGLDPLVYGANFPLNQFGFDVEMKNGDYSNTSNYDADLYIGMVLRCVYKNSGEARYIAVNFELHEVK